MPKAVFFGELRQGKRDRGAPRKRFKDQLKQQLSASASFPEKDWKSIASDRDICWATTKRGAGSFEAVRRETAEEKRRKRKAPAAQSPPAQGFPCPV